VTKIATCLFCGIEYERTTRNPQCVRYRYCSTNCKRAAARQKAATYLASGQPLIAVFEDHVKCLIPGCGAEMRQASTHFARTHGLELHKGLSKWERQRIYGLPQGARVVPNQLRKEYSDRAIERDFGALGKLREFDPAKLHKAAAQIRKEVGMSSQSEAQLATMHSIIGTELHGSQVRKQRAERTSECQNCRKSFTYVAHRKKKFCSISCAGEWSGKHQNEFITEEARGRSGKAISQLRKTRYWSSRASDRWFRVFACLGCGQEKRVIKSKRDRYCSRDCYHRSRVRNKHTF
jgi:hypothetical protein